MRELKIALGNSRQAKFWSNKTIPFDDICERLKTPIRTTETAEEYAKLPKPKRDEIKDKGGFVGGHLRDNLRKVGNVSCRSLWTPDVDNATPEFVAALKDKLTFKCAVYSTHSHTPEAPRLRIVAPFTRDVTADEFMAISRFMAAELGIDMFDECSFIPNQLMYWPTCPSNGEYICEFFDGKPLDPDAILAAHPNWRDCALLPTTSRESKVNKPSKKQQEDPLSKTGVVGAFCRTYSITGAIEAFLSDVYAPSVVEGRYDYIRGESSAGLVLYDDVFAYSHHATDPAYGKLLNAFDLVRTHKFGDKDEKKSFAAMMDFAVKDEAVSALLLREKQSAAAEEFDDWTQGLQRDRSGAIQNSLHNITLMYDSFEVSSVLVIAPLRVATQTWPDEIEKWEHLHDLTYAVAVGTEAERRFQLRRNVDIHIINRENVKWLIEDSGIPFNYDMVVIDELSSFKSHQAKRFKALMKVRPTVKRIVGLTGTPSSNGLMDLWAEYKLLDMGERLGRFIGGYRGRFFTPDKRNQQIVFSYKPLPGAEEHIYRLMSDITISMKSTDYLKMPDCVINEVPVTLSEDEMELYHTMKNDLILNLDDGDVDAVNAAALAGKLSQMANGAVYDENGNAVRIHDRKLDALEDLIEAANGKPVLVAYWFKHDLERIEKRLHSLHIPFSKLDTPDSITRWNRGELPVALVHPASAGHGLNLQSGGSTLIWFGLTWSLELYQQTNARLWRQGQTAATVVIHHIITKGTIDRDIMAALRRKDKTQSALIAAVKANLTK